MHGVKAFLIFFGFLSIASLIVVAVFLLWRDRRKEGLKTRPLIFTTAFLLLWVFLVSTVYIRQARFQYALWKLEPHDVVSIQIGHHDFRDRQSIQDIVSALRHNRWFQSNHGGWGDSILMILRKQSGERMTLDVALYFREPAAIVGPANRQGLGHSGTQSFAPELPQALEKHGVKLPDCDTAFSRPCTAEQLNP